MDIGLSHSCSGIGPPLTAEESAPPPPGIAPVYYFKLAIGVACGRGIAIRRAARDPDSVFYGAFISAIGAAIIFLSAALPRMLRDPARNAGKLFWEALLGLLFVWVTMAVIAVVQLGVCHLVAKFFDAKGTFVGVMRPALLGWFVNCLWIIPDFGGVIVAIVWTAVLGKILRKADGAGPVAAYLIPGTVNFLLLGMTYQVSKLGTP